ncbi:hypothetical protein GCM10027418_31460 [Mariniluteicoccus endophyticus]
MTSQTNDLLVGRYQLLDRIGGGGMGQVWKARDLTLERLVAVKTVDLGHPDPTVAERFRREAIATSRLTNPHVVQVYDAGTDGQTSFLVMELLAGPSLHQVIQEKGRLTVQEGLAVARDVTRGLLGAHAIGVVHRDIKPGNVMYDADGKIKLVDFGIAQLSEKLGATLTAPATALGTAAYMSPEQATGEGATQASDWYALGCLLVTVFTGSPPFSGDAVHVATQQVDGRPPRLSERVPGVPPALDDLVAAMLRKDPAARPSGDQILAQVQALEVDPDAPTMALGADAPATSVLPATPLTPTEPVAPAAPPRSRLAELDEDESRTRWPWVVAALALLAALAFGGWWVLGRDRGEVVPPAVQTPSIAAPTVPAAPRPTTQAPRPTTPQPQPTRTTPTRTPSPTPTTSKKATPSRTPSASATPRADTTAVTSAIDQVSDNGARQQLAKAWDNGDDDAAEKLAKTLTKLQGQGKVTDQEASMIRDAAGLTT